MMCGIPCSGKTTSATQLAAELPALTQLPVTIINEESLLLDRLAAYRNGHTEKNLRDSIKAAAERTVGRDLIVIVDSLNFIKGVRYELFCRARAAGIPHCVVWIDVSPETARARNAACAHYNAASVDDLASRFETPNERNRWDAPLFRVRNQSAGEVEPGPALDGEVLPRRDLPVAELAALLQTTRQPRVSLATKLQPVLESNSLNNVDRVTADVVEAVRALQDSPNASTPGGTLRISSQANASAPYSVALPFPVTRRVSLAELRRHRSSFLKMMQRTTPPTDPAQLADVFAVYLVGQIQSSE
eukprot:TRINITY_DN3314_c0_g1_i2.p1 TRINITY_DN3314_c0_g1~~TRINITY_DN3314_c0_g1_i2.p1  ORF type:complete len:303 (+),score=49.91 TRINITY_DN3314_c0_g1_i2:3-911(+)